MFSRKNKVDSSIEVDSKQKELFEHAQARVNEKRGLYRHFILFLVGCIFMIVLNLVLNFGVNIKPFGLDWFVIGVLVWSFILLVHIFRVILFSKFMGKAWRDKQMYYLVEKQKAKIAKMEKKLDLKVPEEVLSGKTELLNNSDNTETLQ